jgi:NhaP-type Na+/H+ or K+/H+ antiporter
MILFICFVGLIFLYVLFSAKLERTIITAPILFTVTGFLIATYFPEWLGNELKLEVFLMMAEVGLVMILFSDATRLNIKALKSFGFLPVRLLSVGMLLTILLGGVTALILFGQLTIWEAGILAAVLAPTDAGLGQIIVNSPRVPSRIRQSLSMEAGLNDGLSVPFLLFFIIMAQHGTEGAGSVFTSFIWGQLGIGTLMGIGFGLAGGFLLGLAARKKWMSGPLQQIGLVVIPILSVVLSEPAGASMFIVAFVAGMAVQYGFRDAGKHSIEFTEGWGQVFNYLVFFLFGIIAARSWELFNLNILLYAVLSLTVIRMLPVAVSLIGIHLKTTTVLFMGWFGPRGLASIVLGLVFLEHEAKLPGTSVIILTVVMTVLLSIFAHGFTALPGIRLYQKSMNRLPADAPEKQ